ncbi:MAG TPA: ABC transporter permease [Planctomycetota bacterium]|nr:ABC transporter permease [Planctomycetota bacterium]
MAPRMGLRFWKTREFGTASVLVAMLVACDIAARTRTGSSYLLSDSVLRLFQESSFIGIAAVGACAVILSGGVDLSSGSVMGLASVTLAVISTRLGWPAVPAVAGTLAAGTLVGLVNGLLVGYGKLPPFIATLGFYSIARGLSFMLSDRRLSIPRESALFDVLGRYSFWTMIVVGAAAAVVLARFSWGRYVYAVGGNEEAARYSGLRVAAIKSGLYAGAGFCSALAGISLALRYGSGYVDLGRGYELQIIAACAIGGVSFSGGEGSVLGALLGAITLQQLQTLLIFLGVEADRIEIAYGSAIILAVGLDMLRHKNVFSGWLRRAR